MSNFSSSDKLVDWKAVWAFALGPEPELALLLRLALDDNHSSVVSSSVKAIHSVLSCEMNESFFDLSAKLVTSQDIYTAPVFRSKPEIDAGCLHGGYWKYNTKPCNIFPLLCDDEMVDDDENEGKRTIKDDINVASQDFAAGLVRMGVLPKINYLLELQADHSADMEEPLISILIGLARHSPTCASAIIKYPGLVQTIVDIFIKKDTLEVHPSKIKTVTLIKVLAQSDKKVCTEFIEKGIFRTVTWHLYQYPLRLDDWINLGKGSCMLKSALTVEQLRLWKVCIKYGYCISYFADIFPGLYLWLSPPTFDKLIENDVFGEFTDVTRESYLVMEALARRLPYLHSGEQLKKQTIELSDTNVEMWSWSHVVPMVELALKWISLKTNPYLSEFLDSLKGTNTVSPFTNHLLWVISAVMHMLSSVMVKVTPKDYNGFCENDGRVLWLPEFVPSIGLEMIKNNFLNFSSTRDTKPSKRKSLVKLLCQLRRHSNYELSLSSVCCLHGLVQLIVSLDKSIQIAKKEIQTTFSQGYSFAAECKILEDGIVIQSRDELRCLLITLVTLVSHGWHDLQSIETFGRGGPAPGAGLGWGSSSGGFWSEVVLLKRTDALLLISLLEMFQIVPENDVPAIEEMTFIMQRVESALGACLCLGPRDTDIMESSLNVFLQAPVLKYLDICIGRLLVNRSVGPFGWKFREEDYQCFSKILLSHFKSRWLSIKWKKPSAAESNPEQDGSGLDTIYEDPDMSDVTISNPQCTSLIVEWAHQRLPLPVHWFLSPISTIGDHRAASDALQVVMSGLFLLLGLEAMSSLFCTNVECSPVCGVPLVWKIHSLSVVLLGGMGVLQEERSRDLYGTLQELYGQLLDESRCDRKAKSLLDKNERMMPEAGKQYEVDFLKFKSNINDSYSTFVEMLVDQFGAVSYGDVLYGRQVAVYLHHSVEVPVRVATWNILSNAHILELLPSLGKCLGATEGYLDTEDNEEVLEAYVKSWITGALDRAADRGSMSFTLALHHLSYFLFYNNTDDKSILRIKLTKSLLRDYLRKEQHKYPPQVVAENEKIGLSLDGGDDDDVTEVFLKGKVIIRAQEGMMLELIQYTKPETCGELERKEAALPHASEVERRFKLLAEACEGNRSLLDKVEKLKF
ncbi:hypothetical protein GIB67_002168 [Kingdonia uniflora]|uniref:RPAP1/MINIYO-like TPR repeats domain-containing protein n=1 Tax=Kingdonia uniflora TaxID=39325 RepID=A0A7J7KWP7_9MAGN|nr:hypothetical protein GIB67_002168 [Kingdonia uniflora]